MNNWTMIFVSDKQNRTLHGSLLQIPPTEGDETADHKLTFQGHGVRVHVRIWGDSLRDEFIAHLLRDYFGDRKHWQEVSLNPGLKSAEGGLTLFKNKSTVLSTKYA